MKAAVLTAPERMETVDDWPEPVCGPGDVVMETHGVGLCGSDVAVFHGKRVPPSTPWVFGHEGFGRIVRTGADVTDRLVGRRVVIEPHHARLTCAGCLTGLTSACPHRAIAGLNAPGGDFTAALTELPDARPGAMIEARFPLARAQEAFAGAAGRAGKTWIHLGSEHE
ncbi:alcohol dehydrogenase catalytic domain-containing protein [Streptomyces sp. SAI-041]|uniref:alcohol dehydrogenase catalytic domain-containing protein n=1 Tax=Streptomyces sp. SAI-041 TaxID=2940548 RepID=UPI0024735EF9|nr:alcohol dehydrogenase catalytic domain-containing protein [Streptomyces sp. SAI-041]MDH6553375.1 threonine dehydrogenase-like Zn-dependent dehydrogenase [Streptomyces sp. SAI-041]